MWVFVSDFARGVTLAAAADVLPTGPRVGEARVCRVPVYAGVRPGVRPLA
jgi:hypothetical protein